MRGLSFLSSPSATLLLHLLHHSQEITSPQLSDFFFGIARFEQTYGNVDQVVVTIASLYSATAVKVGADAYVVDACHLNAVLQVVHEIAQRGIFQVLTQEVGAGTHLHHATLLGQGTQLFISQVTVVAKERLSR